MITLTGPICALFGHLLAVCRRGLRLCPILADNCGLLREAPRSRGPAQGRQAARMVD
jgi:hypothetical protein